MNTLVDETLTRLTDERQRIKDEIKFYDKAMTDYYHLFEFGAFPDDVLMHLHGNFVNTLHRRRQCKYKVELLNPMINSIKQSIASTEARQRRYTPRVLSDEFIQYAQYMSFI